MKHHELSATARLSHDTFALYKGDHAWEVAIVNVSFHARRDSSNAVVILFQEWSVFN